VACRRFVIMSMTSHGSTSNLEKAIRAAVREFFDSGAEEKAVYEARDSDELECIAYTPCPDVCVLHRRVIIHNASSSR